MSADQNSPETFQSDIPDAAFHTAALALVGKSLREAEENLDRLFISDQARAIVENALQDAFRLVSNTQEYWRNNADVIVASALREAQTTLQDCVMEEQANHELARGLVKCALQETVAFLERSGPPTDQECFNEATKMVKHVLWDAQNFVSATPKFDGGQMTVEMTTPVPVISNEPKFSAWSEGPLPCSPVSHFPNSCNNNKNVNRPRHVAADSITTYLSRLLSKTTGGCESRRGHSPPQIGCKGIKSKRPFPAAVKKLENTKNPTYQINCKLDTSTHPPLPPSPPHGCPPPDRESSVPNSQEEKEKENNAKGSGKGGEEEMEMTKKTVAEEEEGKKRNKDKEMQEPSQTETAATSAYPPGNRGGSMESEEVGQSSSRSWPHIGGGSVDSRSLSDRCSRSQSNSRLPDQLRKNSSTCIEVSVDMKPAVNCQAVSSCGQDGVGGISGSFRLSASSKPSCPGRSCHDCQNDSPTVGNSCPPKPPVSTNCSPRASQDCSSRERPNCDQSNRAPRPSNPCPKSPSTCTPKEQPRCPSVAERNPCSPRPQGPSTPCPTPLPNCCPKEKFKSPSMCDHFDEDPCVTKPQCPTNPFPKPPPTCPPKEEPVSPPMTDREPCSQRPPSPSTPCSKSLPIFRSKEQSKCDRSNRDDAAEPCSKKPQNASTSSRRTPQEMSDCGRSKRGTEEASSLCSTVKLPPSPWNSQGGRTRETPRCPPLSKPPQNCGPKAKQKCPSSCDRLDKDPCSPEPQCPSNCCPERDSTDPCGPKPHRTSQDGCQHKETPSCDGSKRDLRGIHPQVSSIEVRISSNCSSKPSSKPKCPASLSQRPPSTCCPGERTTSELPAPRPSSPEQSCLQTNPRSLTTWAQKQNCRPPKPRLRCSSPTPLQQPSTSCDHETPQVQDPPAGPRRQGSGCSRREPRQEASCCQRTEEAEPFQRLCSPRPRSKTEDDPCAPKPRPCCPLPKNEPSCGSANFSDCPIRCTQKTCRSKPKSCREQSGSEEEDPCSELLTQRREDSELTCCRCSRRSSAQPCTRKQSACFEQERAEEEETEEEAYCKSSSAPRSDSKPQTPPIRTSFCRSPTPPIRRQFTHSDSCCNHDEEEEEDEDQGCNEDEAEADCRPKSTKSNDSLQQSQWTSVSISEGPQPSSTGAFQFRKPIKRCPGKEMEKEAPVPVNPSKKSFQDDVSLVDPPSVCITIGRTIRVEPLVSRNSVVKPTHCDAFLSPRRTCSPTPPTPQFPSSTSSSSLPRPSTFSPVPKARSRSLSSQTWMDNCSPSPSLPSPPPPQLNCPLHRCCTSGPCCFTLAAAALMQPQPGRGGGGGNLTSCSSFQGHEAMQMRMQVTNKPGSGYGASCKAKKFGPISSLGGQQQHGSNVSASAPPPPRRPPTNQELS